jgi:hypothetical protein
LEHIRKQLNQYEVETRGVYIQDVILPEALVQVLAQREIANKEKATFPSFLHDNRPETQNPHVQNNEHGGHVFDGQGRMGQGIRPKMAHQYL